jgi:hypothetical protein
VLARLIRNPQEADGSPPFALTDQAGTIQRYVEPVPGIDLNPYVDQVVTVRHDTGRTLLASQLELPPFPMLPLIGDRGAELVPLSQPPFVARTQFVDNDDATVQLLPEGQDGSERAENSATGDAEVATAPRSDAPAGEELPEAGTPTTPVGSSEEAGAGEGFELHDPTSTELSAAEWGDTAPCAECGGFHFSSECDPAFGGEFAPYSHGQPPQQCRLFADVELNFLRTHLNSGVVGKLSEKYEFSPRLIFGFRDAGPIDGRVRFWHYGRDTTALGNGPIRVEFDVLDLEATHLFDGRRSEVLLSTGMRLAGIDITDNDNDSAGADLLGMTIGAEGRTCLCSFQGGLVSWIYGGRMSILGGDWGAEAGSDFLPGLTQDDNLVVHELSTGIDYAVRHRGFDFHARLGFEMQNWHSDALSPDSIGLIGPGFQFGAEF